MPRYSTPCCRVCAYLPAVRDSLKHNFRRELQGLGSARHILHRKQDVGGHAQPMRGALTIAPETFATG